MKIKFEPNEFEVGKEYHGKIVEVETFPLPVDGSLLRVKENPKVYWMQNGKKRWIETGEIFQKMEKDLGFTQADIRLIEAWQIKTIPEGKTISQWPENIWPEPSVDKLIMAYLPIRWPPEYWGLAQAKELGFTVMHSHECKVDFWAEQLNTAHSLGMKCAVQTIERADRVEMKACIDNAKDHPATLMYVGIDDFDWREIPKERQRAVYDLIKEFDSDKPVAISGADWKWEEFFEPKAFDILLYQVYAYRNGIPDPDAWLKYMCDRLSGYDLTGKRIIPVIQTFGPLGDFNIPQIEHAYEVLKTKLGLKSVGCYSWEGLAKSAEFRDEVITINSDV